MSVKTVHTQIAILGGGPAGYVAAIRAAQLGAQVIVVEEQKLGGVCLNRGCIPTKALLRTGYVANLLRRSTEFGIDSSINTIKWNTAVQRKDRVVKSLHSGLGSLLPAKGITIVQGAGKLLSATEIAVTTTDGPVHITCDKLILSIGTTPAVPPIPGIQSDNVIDSTMALEMEELPSSIAILGAGVIGVEFATLFSALGVKVTVLEMLDHILPGVDGELTSELLKSMKRQKISFKLGAAVTEVSPSDTGLVVAYRSGEKDEKIACDKLLVATGRSLNSECLGDLPIKITKQAIIVDNHMQTSIPGIYAAGDCVGAPLLAHLAFMEGKVAAECALGMDSAVNYAAVPSCIYTNPEIACVGISEVQANAQGISVKTGRYDFRSNGRAQTLGDREGFVKVIADENGVIVGGQILGPEASEMISELTLAITLKAKLQDLANMIHPHPTLSEAIWEACNIALGTGIHHI